MAAQEGMTMQIFRTAPWVLVAALIVLCGDQLAKDLDQSVPLDNGYLHVDWPVG
jgi:hypothetical protein